ncbi:winged helix-turn-helix domain-containing protein [Spirosoma utsteinense]|uniref:DNA-binding response OmpR family regulator n=1 Tax=Spirosoma utsteinense TaxID=2585773 RepID=A0ABR6WDK8_9BACT|nr:winged helix-turn-helix domain-containing protein [Spirosoma utsteinense]MBC3788696.1 DNA-binding response OmpR family regulator [Spirosoma utsteinense]MBC3794612.1 DNA-binding response OmpR family regulator [Spirosoma utsteinense]
MRYLILTVFFLLVTGLPGYSDGEKVLVTMRQIGHELLLASGDSTSWVGPIEEVDERTFLIRFQRPFAFKPASLVAIIHRHLQQNQGSLDYLVEVSQEKRNTVAYSYEVHQPLNPRTIACLTRRPPRGAYTIKIQFAQPPVQTASIGSVVYLAWLLLPVLLIGIGWRLVNRKTLPSAPVEPVVPLHLVYLGPLTFCLEKQILRLGANRIELSSKESKLLKVFAISPNVVIDRNRLMEQVWGEEGVFVGRSLDVFVSRLRKKLQPAPTVRIVNSHGRGYKLEIDSPKGPGQAG